MATDYGKRLVSAMFRAGLTQKDLVQKTGLSQSTISSAINRGNGSSHTALFAKVCNVNAHWLSTGEGSEEQAPSNDDVPERLRAVLMTVAGLFRTIPEDQWGDALMDVAQVLQRGRRL
jgi:transcriptional regulator with XRE-family HTH domain